MHKITNIMKNYLVLPINNDAENRDICITPVNGKPYGLSVRLDSTNPKYYEYIDITHLGIIESVSLKENEYSFANKKPDSIYKEDLRPKIHFTPSNGWNNDPNGIVYYDGVYHMFYQHNPAGNTWGNMHWGHATSKDMIHFTEEDIALFPDHLGAVYSGSAIVDFDNVSGLKENENDVIILFYTAAGYRFNQCIAYSTDKGKTFKRYSKNPILSYSTFWNRDPKVIKCDDLNCYVMALFLDENTYMLYKSHNLLDWEELQKVDIPDDYECPDIFKIKVEETGEYVYVLQGACGAYLIGKVEGNKFVFDKTPHKNMFGNYIDYCGQSYSNLGERVVQVYWQKSIVYTNMPWGSNLSLPQEVTMHKDNKGNLNLYYYIAKEFNDVKKEIYDANKINNNCGYDISSTIEFEKETQLKCFGIDIPIPEQFINSRINVRIIVDTIGVTIYINEGQRFTSLAALPDYKLKPLEATQGKIIDSTIYSIKSFLN